MSRFFANDDDYIKLYDFEQIIGLFKAQSVYYRELNFVQPRGYKRKFDFFLHIFGCLLFFFVDFSRFGLKKKNSFPLFFPAAKNCIFSLKQKCKSIFFVGRTAKEDVKVQKHVF